MRITVETFINSNPKTVWAAWTTPNDIRQWNLASDEWHCPHAEIDLKVGGTFNYRMAAKDESAAFDFVGTFTNVAPYQSIHYKIEDGRDVEIEFIDADGGVNVIESFEAENIHSADQQKQGWQSILDNFKRHVEGRDS